MLGQDDNERIMGEHLRHWDMAVQWNTELVALEQQPDRVVATLKDPDGSTRTIAAAYVAGCDGSRSSVRELSGIGFPGAPYEHAFFVADTDATGPMVADELNVFLWRSGFHLYFPMRGTNRWRVIGILPRELSAKDHLTFEELIPSLLQVGGPGLSFNACHWFSTYRIHHRCTERFRDRRAFLLGDAAHIHSPMGGQGMNTGLQDAYNLAWKLALVISDRADQSLLDTYEAERRPFAQQLLATTDRAFRVVVSDGWLAGMLRTQVVPRVAAIAMRRKQVQRAAFRTISQIGIRYRSEPAFAHARGREQEGAAGRRSVSVAAAQVSRAGRAGRPVPAHGRHALQPDRHRAARTIGGEPWSRRHAAGARHSRRRRERPRACRSVHHRPGVLSRPSRRTHRPRRHTVSGGRPQTVAGDLVPATRRREAGGRVTISPKKASPSPETSPGSRLRPRRGSVRAWPKGRSGRAARRGVAPRE